MTVDPRGLVRGVEFIASPNCDERPAGMAVSLLVVHSISLPPGEFGSGDVAALFCNALDCSAHPFYAELAGLRVSAHLFVRRTGTIVQFVPCTLRAWHAGVSSWRGRTRCNDFSIGIELEGTDTSPFEPVQYERLASLVRAMRRAYPIEDVVGHSDVAPGRKTDPGAGFDWARLRSLVAARR